VLPEREKARQRVYDAMVRKAKAGHVTGGRVFGYDNEEVTVTGPDGKPKRSHVERRINEEQAVVVGEIFDLAAQGYGQSRIAKRLNERGRPCPRPQQGRPAGWAPSSVRAVLRRPLYKGQIVWNRTRKRDVWGKKKQQDRPEGEWLVVLAPELRIVSDEVWENAHRQLAANRERYTRPNQSKGRPPGAGAKYLLAGLAKCGTCGAGIEAHSRMSGKQRQFFYGCSAHHRKGSRVCENGLLVPMAEADKAVLDSVKQALLDPAVVEAALDRAVAELTNGGHEQQIQELQRKLADTEGELSRLASAVAAGGNIPALITTMEERERLRRSLEDQLQGLKRARPGAEVDPATVRRQLRAVLDDWQGSLRRNAPEARRMVTRLIAGRLVMTPKKDKGREFYEFRGTGTVEPVIAGVAHKLASPTGYAPFRLIGRVAA